MGTDIHLMVEQRLPSGKWVGVWREWGVRPQGRISPRAEIGQSGLTTTEQCYIYPYVGDRNYELFAALAGVRGEGPDPKGLPVDVSEWALAEVERYDSDGHSHGWCTLWEFTYLWHIHNDKLQKLAKGLFTENEKTKVKAVIALWGEYFEVCDMNDFRVIYWFDN